MRNMDLRDLLEQVARGEITPEQAERALGQGVESLSDLGVIDFQRFQRCGVPEVVYGPGKSGEQLQAIMGQFVERRHPVFMTRLEPERAEPLLKTYPNAEFHRHARALTLDFEPLPEPVGDICIVTAGSSDEQPAAEAALTARRMGASVRMIRDVGVAGLHRLLARIDEIRTARVVIAVAGMEAALVSVVGGLIDRPLIALPTSVGYGMHLEGLTAFMAMLNTCVAGVTVVNVDNGFGAGIAAAQINRLAENASHENSTI